MNIDITNDTTQNVIYNYIIRFTQNDISTSGFSGNMYSIYRNLFTKYINLLFFWQKKIDEDNVHIFAIYKYKNLYIIVDKNEIFDWNGIKNAELLNNKINNISNNFHFYNNIVDIILSINNSGLQEQVRDFLLLEEKYCQVSQSVQL
jgi:hypothetical protein